MTVAIGVLAPVEMWEKERRGGALEGSMYMEIVDVFDTPRRIDLGAP